MPGWNLKSFNVARSYWLAHMGVQFVPSWNAQLRCYCFLRHSFWPLRGYSRFMSKEYCKSLGLLGHDGTCRKRYSPTWQCPWQSPQQPKITLFEASNRRDPAGSIWRNQNSRNIRPFFECQLVLYIYNEFLKEKGRTCTETCFLNFRPLSYCRASTWTTKLWTFEGSEMICFRFRSPIWAT